MAKEQFLEYFGLTDEPNQIYTDVITSAEFQQSQCYHTIDKPEVISNSDQSVYMLAEGICGITKAGKRAPTYYARQPGTIIGLPWFVDYTSNTFRSNEEYIIESASQSASFHMITFDCLNDLLTQGKASVRKKMFDLCIKSTADLTTSVTAHEDIMTGLHGSRDKILTLLDILRQSDNSVTITHAKMARLMGYKTRESVSYVLENLMGLGYVDLRYGEIILNYDELPEEHFE